jgi:hypothetical protein
MISVSDRLLSTPRRGVPIYTTDLSYNGLYEAIRHEFGIKWITETAYKVSGRRFVPSREHFIKWLIMTERLEVLKDGCVLWYDSKGVNL